MSKPLSYRFSRTTGEGRALVKQVSSRGDKITSSKVLGITKEKNGKIVWLEEGSSSQKPSGLLHIINRHEKEFQKIGINNKEVPQFIMTALHNGTIVGYQGKGTTRPIYQFTYEGITQFVAITIGSNGYIVGANPTNNPEGNK